MKWFISPLLFFTLMVAVSPALAAEEGSIRFQSIAEIEIESVDANGNKVIERIPAEKVMPETAVIYTNRFTNIGDQPASGLVITNPIAEGMVYVIDSAVGANATVTFSVDGGSTFDVPEALEVIGNEGKPRTATAEDYTHIRWKIGADLSPQATGEVSFQAYLK